MNKKELISKLAEVKSIILTVEEMREIAESNTVYSQIMDWFDTEYAEKYDLEIKNEHLIEMNFTENGIRYYYGREKRFLDFPVGEESWDEEQWDAGALQELLGPTEKCLELILGLMITRKIIIGKVLES